MKGKRFKIYFTLALLMVSFVFVNTEPQVYAATENLIPAMTSNTTPSGTASASSNVGGSYIYQPYTAFNHKGAPSGNENYWVSTSKPAWLAYEFPEAKIVTKYTLTQDYDGSGLSTVNGRCPRDWTFEGWNEVTNQWDILDTRMNITNWEYNVKREFTFNNSNPYKKYRINITENNDGSPNVAIGEMEMMEGSPAPVSVLDIEPEKETINLNETVIANLVIDNINDITAKDIRIAYDNQKLEFLGFEEVSGIKLVKSLEETGSGELRVILASKGEANIINAKEILLKLNFKGIAMGEALVDITRGRVTDGIEMERDLTEVECHEGIITVEGLADVNNSGEFTLLDLGIDARHLTKDPASPELAQYNTDIVVNGQIDEDDLLEIGRLILENPNYLPNN